MTGLPQPSINGPIPARALQEQLRESEERFRIMADSAPVMLWLARTDALCDFFNKGWLDFTGRPLERELYNGWAEGVHAEDFQRCMTIYMEAFAERRPFRMEYRLRRHDGQYRWILDTGVPRFSGSGEFAGYVGSCIDITDIREAHELLQKINAELEQRVTDRTAELQRSNEELEQFAYAASHDLQAPLRSISGFVGLLQRRYSSQLDEEAREFIGYVAEGTQRMQTLIADLLAYSRSGHGKLNLEAVDMNAALGRALANLKAAADEAGAVIANDGLPTVRADATQVTQVLQNLVGNAIKFRAGNGPQVRVSARAAEGGWQLSVADNGIGIPAEQRDRVFRMFHRLHPPEQYPGSGIGLAITKRVIERHGGRIWVESQPGLGSTFHFTLPGVPK